MKNRIAAGDVPIVLAGRRVVLRPTLRAAMTLARHERGFDGLLQAIESYDVEVIVEIIALGLGRSDIDELTAEVWATGLGPLMHPLRRYLFVVHAGGRAPDEKEPGQEGATAERITLVDFCDELAEIALGWLGWSEEAALNADMNSIRAGYAGRVSMLKAILGGKEEADKPVVSTRPLTMELFDALFGQNR